MTTKGGGHLPVNLYQPPNPRNLFGFTFDFIYHTLIDNIKPVKMNLYKRVTAISQKAPLPFIEDEN